MAKYTKPLTAKEDEEGGGNRPSLRLPFALCKERGIQLPDWATPRDAWNALKGFGIDPKKEYEEYYKRIAEREEKKRLRKQKKEQMKMPEHNPDYKYKHEEGKIAGVEKRAPMTFEEADGSKCNPNYEKGLIGYDTNCQTCVVAFEARKRGYDVRALPNLRNGYIRDLSKNPLQAYENAGTWDLNNSVHKAFGEHYSQVDDYMKEGQRYVIRWKWATKNVGHIITCFKENGKSVYYDPQTGSKMEYSAFYTNYVKYMDKGEQFSLKRVDNLKFNDEYLDHILKASE